MQDQQMSSRELVLKTIKHEHTKKVPKGELVLDDDVIRNVINSDSVGFDERVEFVNQLGHDLISLSPTYSKSNEFAIDTAHLNIEKWNQNTSLFTFVILDGSFEYGLRTFGFESFLSMVMAEPDKTKEFIAKVEKLNLDTVSKLADCGVDGIIVADDIAYQNGLMIHPTKFRELFLPSLEYHVSAIEKRQMIPFFHSDGNYLAVMGDIIASGFKGLHCLDKKCGIELNKLQPYANDICLWGHLDVDDLNSSQDPAIMARLIQDMEKTTDFRGFILGTNSGLFSGLDINELKNIYRNVDDWNK